jgi:hypothetical protein
LEISEDEATIKRRLAYGMLRKYSMYIKFCSEKYKGMEDEEGKGKAMRTREVDLHFEHLMKMSSRMRSLMIRSKSFNPGDETWNSGEKFHRHSRGCKLLKNYSGFMAVFKGLFALRRRIFNLATILINGRKVLKQTT